MPTPRKLTPALLEEARLLAGQDLPVREIAERLRVGKTQLAAALAAPPAKPDAIPDNPDTAPELGDGGAGASGPPLDPEATPLEMARALLGSISRSIAKLPASSPRLNQARGQLRQTVKLVAELERELARDATPQEAERQRRIDDGDTRKAIERYVNQALEAALRPTEEAPHGRCPTCLRPMNAAEREQLVAP